MEAEIWATSCVCLPDGLTKLWGLYTSWTKIEDTKRQSTMCRELYLLLENVILLKSGWFAREFQFKMEERNRVGIHSQTEDICRHSALISNYRAHSLQTQKASAVHPNTNHDTSLSIFSSALTTTYRSRQLTGQQKEHITCYLIYTITHAHTQKYWISINLKWAWNQRNRLLIYRRPLTSTNSHTTMNIVFRVKFGWYVNRHQFSTLCINRQLLPAHWSIPGGGGS